MFWKNIIGRENGKVAEELIGKQGLVESFVSHEWK